MNKFNIFSFNLRKFFVNFLQTSLLLLHHPFLFYFFQEFQEIFTIYLHTLRNLTKVQEMKRNGFQNIEKTALTIFNCLQDKPSTFMICHILCELSQTLWFVTNFVILSHVLWFFTYLWFVTNFVILSQTLWFVTCFVICHKLCDFVTNFVILSQTLWFVTNFVILSQTLWRWKNSCKFKEIFSYIKKQQDFFDLEIFNLTILNF